MLSFLTVTLYHNIMFLRLLFCFNLLFLFRLVEIELHGSVPLRGIKVTCVPSF